ncbi:MAG: HAD family hydrolase [Spirochaetales bacterium]|nr:HAD family hydrolase [Spirochaetales bacterium]
MEIIAHIKNPRCLIFDIDQTLYDNREYYEGQIDLLINRLAEKQGLSYKEMASIVNQKQNEYMAENEGRKLSLGNLFLRFGVTIEENCIWRSELFEPEKFLIRDEKLIATMEVLSEKFKIAAVTNTATDIAIRTLRVLGVESFFPLVIGLDQTRVSKPTFKPFAAAADALCVPYNQCISIGDRLNVDIETPVRHGMGGILVHSMEDIYNLPDLLAKAL